MKIKNASAGALSNFEVLNFFQSRGASKEVAVTITPSEYKVFEYLIGTAAPHQTTESISVLMDKVKKYDLAKSEVLNIVNLRPTLPVGVYTIVENCDVRLGEEGAQELVDMVADVLPLPERRGEADLDNASDAPTGDLSMERIVVSLWLLTKTRKIICTDLQIGSTSPSLPLQVCHVICHMSPSAAC